MPPVLVLPLLFVVIFGVALLGVMALDAGFRPNGPITLGMLIVGAFILAVALSAPLMAWAPWLFELD